MRFAAARCWTNCSGVTVCLAPGLPPPIVAPGCHTTLLRLSLSTPLEGEPVGGVRSRGSGVIDLRFGDCSLESLGCPDGYITEER